MTPTSFCCGSAQPLVVHCLTLRGIEHLFEYDAGMSTHRDDRPAMRLRETPRGWAEQAPKHCPQCGAVLGAGKVLVGATACQCGRSHRTHFCRSCEFTIFSPALGQQCRLVALDERDMRPGGQKNGWAGPTE